jgi:hypothetical protein
MGWKPSEIPICTPSITLHLNSKTPSITFNYCTVHTKYIMQVTLQVKYTTLISKYFRTKFLVGFIDFWKNILYCFNSETTALNYHWVHGQTKSEGTALSLDIPVVSQFSSIQIHLFCACTRLLVVLVAMKYYTYHYHPKVRLWGEKYLSPLLWMKRMAWFVRKGPENKQTVL